MVSNIGLKQKHIVATNQIDIKEFEEHHPILDTLHDFYWSQKKSEMFLNKMQLV